MDEKKKRRKEGWMKRRKDGREGREEGWRLGGGKGRQAFCEWKALESI